MIDRYEISLWEDFPNMAGAGDTSFLDERKLCVIGSDTMTSQSAAIEPKMVTNINGTNTFSFKMYYKYIDTLTGEDCINPFMNLLVNERKVKVHWKDEWYDMVIKNMEEDTSARTITYTCQDLFITELSKNGYELEFSAEQQNNIGTASELITMVLDGSGWTFDSANSESILQETEEAVYNVETLADFSAQHQSAAGDESAFIPSGSTILMFYSSINQIEKNEAAIYDDIQFIYASDGFRQDPGEMVVTNEDCCYTASFKANKSNGVVYLNSTGSDSVAICSIDLTNGISTTYRGNRLVKTYKSVYDDLLDRYVYVYEDASDSNHEVYGYSTTEFTDPMMVVNLVANPNTFKGTEGWITAESAGLTWKLYPEFANGSEISEYNPISYLALPSGIIYNSGLSANQTYLKPSQGDIKAGNTYGFHAGDKYILRAKIQSDNNGPSGSYIGITNNSESNYIVTSGNFSRPNKISILPIITNSFKDDYTFDKDNFGQNIYTNYLSTVLNYSYDANTHWNEFQFEFKESIPADELENFGLFFETNSPLWVEDIQFFKLTYGKTSYDDNAETKIIYPGQISLQGISETIYHFYHTDHDGATTAEGIKFIYEGPDEHGPKLNDNWEEENAPFYINRFVPVTNNYEKMTSIEAKGSNRFNILQSIAESFECWIKFYIKHNEETGEVEKDSNGLPIKKVQLLKNVGKDLGWSFEYGIDLKTIKRKVISDDITTKVIVIPNENEYATNGFCTIARSDLNYPKENFIINMDYFVDQGLLDKDVLNKDLYMAPALDSDGLIMTGGIGYYYQLHKFNKEYDQNTELLIQKKTEYTKQNAQVIVLENKAKAIAESLTSNESDLIALCGTLNWQGYAKTHMGSKKISSLVNTRTQLLQEQQKTLNLLHEYKGYEITENNITITYQGSLDLLKNKIEDLTERQKQIIGYTKELHQKFFQKYSRFIQEGTWQDNNYIDDNKYYLDALNVAYTSSRPKVEYDINIMRLSALEDFKSKIFNIGDICYVQDRDYFGYEEDGVTPKKLKIVISEITSYFMSPEKDTLKVQNYKTQFDDLFQRITATTQSLQYQSGAFEKAAGVINHDKTLSFNLLQSTFDDNEDLVLNASNQHVTWDQTGITVTDEQNTALQVKVMAGGLFVSNDGGNSWKNAVRGDGISADVITAGRINTGEIFIYDGNTPTFRWDEDGITAYSVNSFVRFDQFGLYNYIGSDNFSPASEDSIWGDDSVSFAITPRGIKLGSGLSDGATFTLDNNGVLLKLFSEEGNSLEISTQNDIVLKTPHGENETIDRVQIGRHKTWDINPAYDSSQPASDTNPQYLPQTDYGMWIYDSDGNSVFTVNASGENSFGGWTLSSNSFYHEDNNQNKIGFYSVGSTTEICGATNDFYIVAGDSFGVTIDGKMYSASGKIGGWNITGDALYNSVSNGEIYLQSDGSLRGGQIHDDEWAPSSFEVADNSALWPASASLESGSRGQPGTGNPIIKIYIGDINTKDYFTYNESTQEGNYSPAIDSFYTIIYPTVDSQNSALNSNFRIWLLEDAEHPWGLGPYSWTYTNQETGEQIVNYWLKALNDSYYYQVLYWPEYLSKTKYTYTNNGSTTTYDVKYYWGRIWLDQINDYVTPGFRKCYRWWVGGKENVNYKIDDFATSEDHKFTSNDWQSISFFPNPATTTNQKWWKIDNDGNATFSNINATGGTIAGWRITDTCITNGYTTLDSTLMDINKPSINRYTINTTNISVGGGGGGGSGKSPKITLDYDGKITGTSLSLTSGVGGTLNGNQLSGLTTLLQNWGTMTPKQVREAGINSVDVVSSNISFTGGWETVEASPNNYKGIAVTASIGLQGESWAGSSGGPTTTYPTNAKVTTIEKTLNAQPLWNTAYDSGVSAGFESGFAQASETTGASDWVINYSNLHQLPGTTSWKVDAIPAVTITMVRDQLYSWEDTFTGSVTLDVTNIYDAGKTAGESSGSSAAFESGFRQCYSTITATSWNVMKSIWYSPDSGTTYYLKTKPTVQLTMSDGTTYWPKSLNSDPDEFVSVDIDITDMYNSIWGTAFNQGIQYSVGHTYVTGTVNDNNWTIWRDDTIGQNGVYETYPGSNNWRLRVIPQATIAVSGYNYTGSLNGQGTQTVVIDVTDIAQKGTVYLNYGDIDGNQETWYLQAKCTRCGEQSKYYVNAPPRNYL